MRDLVFVLGFCCMLPFVFRRPHIGVLLWAWTALLTPNSFLYGFAYSFQFNLIVAVTTILCWVFSKEPKRIPGSSTVILLILFGILATTSAYLTISNPDIVWREWSKLIKMLIFALVVVGLINSRLRMESLVYAIVFSLGFLGVLEGAKFLASGGGHSIVGPGSSIIADNNHFALAMVCTIPLIFFLYHQTTHRWLRIGLAGGGVLLFFTVVGTFSRGGLIGLSAVVLWAFLKSAQKGKLLVLIIPLVFALVAFAPDRWFNRMDSISTAGEDSSFLGRVIAWKQSTVIALDHPVVGGGFHAVQNLAVWREYAVNKFYALSFIPTPDPEWDRAKAAHSIYFQVLGDMGFVGLALFLALGFVAWRNTIIIIRKAKGRNDLEWASKLAQAIQYSLVGYYVAGAALSLAYFELMYILFAMLASLRMLVERPVVVERPVQVVNETEYAGSAFASR